MTKQISLPFTLTIAGNAAHMTGKAVVLRTDFGLGQGEWASPATIAHEVTITVDLTATKVPLNSAIEWRDEHRRQIAIRPADTAADP